MSNSKKSNESAGEKLSLLKSDKKLQSYLDYDFGGLWRPLSDVGVADVKAGDVIRTLYYGFDHAVVVESVLIEKASGSLPKTSASITVDVIHLGRPNWAACARQVMRDQLTLSANGKYNFLFELPSELCYPAETTLSRARSRLNEPNWNPLSSPLDFAMWCKIPCRFQHRDCLVPMRPPWGDGAHHSIATGCHANLPVVCGSSSSELHVIVTGVTDLATRGSSKLILIDYRAVASRYDELRPPELHEDVLTLCTGTVIKRLAKNPGRQNCEDGAAFEITEAKAAMNKYACCGVATERNLPDWLLLKLLLLDGCPENLLDAGSRVLNFCNRKPNFYKAWPQDVQPGDLLVGLPDGSSAFVLEPASMTANSVMLRVARFRYRASLPADAKPGLHIVDRRLLASADDHRLRLCVHNWDSEDCEVLGGSLIRTPDYSVQRIQSTSELSPGLPVCLERLLMYQHALVTAVETTDHPDEVVLTLVYYATRLVASIMFLQRIVSTRRARINLKKQRLFLIEYHVADNRRVTGEAAVKLALSRLGEAEYNVQWNSSRDLVRWCCISHPTNREFCRIPILYGRELETAVANGQVQIMYPRAFGIYDHHVMMRDCMLLAEGDRCDLLSFRCYESAEPNEVVLIEKLILDDLEIVGRVRYDGRTNSLEVMRDKATQLLGASFISEATDAIVSARLLCEWLKLSEGSGPDDLMNLLIGSGFNPKEVRTHLELFIALSDLKPADHLIIRRNGKTKEHVLLLDWNGGPEADFVRFAVPSSMEGFVGPLETRGYMIVTRNPSQSGVFVNVRNRPVDFELMDKRMSCISSRDRAYYDILSYNCEHMCGFLANGRTYSEQSSVFANRAASLVVKTGRSIYPALLPMSNLFNLLGHFRYFITGGTALVSLLLLATIDSIAVYNQADRFGMTRRELRRRLGQIGVLALFSAISSVLAFLMGHYLSDRFSQFTMETFCALVAVPLSLTGVVLCRLADYYRRVHVP